MKGMAHVLVGTTTLFTVALMHSNDIEFAHNVVNPVIGMLTVSAGSYAPDIVIQRTHLGMKYKFISKHLTHRGITHTLLVPFLLYYLIYSNYLPYVVNSLIFGFLFGWVVHLLVDLLNIQKLKGLMKNTLHRLRVYCSKRKH